MRDHRQPEPALDVRIQEHEADSAQRVKRSRQTVPDEMARLEVVHESVVACEVGSRQREVEVLPVTMALELLDQAELPNERLHRRFRLLPHIDTLAIARDTDEAPTPSTLAM